MKNIEKEANLKIKREIIRTVSYIGRYKNGNIKYRGIEGK